MSTMNKNLPRNIWRTLSLIKGNFYPQYAVCWHIGSFSFNLKRPCECLNLTDLTRPLNTTAFLRMPSKETEQQTHTCTDTDNSALKRKMPSSESQIVMQFAKLSEHATAPTRGSERAAGLDLYSAYDYTIKAKGKEIVKTDIQIAVPVGCYGRVAPRSGLAAKNFIDVGAGVIDEDYRGNVGVVLFNFSDEEFVVKRGDRIAQLICEKIAVPVLEELPELDKTQRGSNGYGSTGKN